jgi:hypothetical protein
MLNHMHEAGDGHLACCLLQLLRHHSTSLGQDP